MALGIILPARKTGRWRTAGRGGCLPSATSVGIHPSKSQRTQRTMISTKMPLTRPNTPPNSLLRKCRPGSLATKFNPWQRRFHTSGTPKNPIKKRMALASDPAIRLAASLRGGGSPGLCALIDLFLQGL